MFATSEDQITAEKSASEIHFKPAIDLMMAHGFGYTYACHYIFHIAKTKPESTLGKSVKALMNSAAILRQLEETTP